MITSILIPKCLVPTGSGLDHLSLMVTSPLWLTCLWSSSIQAPTTFTWTSWMATLCQILPSDTQSFRAWNRIHMMVSEPEKVTNCLRNMFACRSSSNLEFALEIRSQWSKILYPLIYVIFNPCVLAKVLELVYSVSKSIISFPLIIFIHFQLTF